MAETQIIPKSDFVHLHLHSQYSLLDGACRISDAVQKAKEYGMHALAVTDHGNLFGAIEFYKKAKSAGVKPIIGCEMYYAPNSRYDRAGIDDAVKERNYHLVLLAKSEKGYKNLIQLSSQSYLEGFYYKPRIDWEILEKYHEDIVCLSACMKGEVPNLFMQGQESKALEKAGRMAELFGRENFYLELQENGIDAQRTINKQLFELSKKLNLQVVATNDCHYLTRESAKNHDVLLCIQTGKTLDDPDRLKFQTDEFYFKSPEEMKRAFAEIPDAIHNTIDIADRCNIELTFGKPLLPQYQVPQGHTLDSYLDELAYRGLQERYPIIGEELENRLKYELDIIKRMGFSGYFLIVWDFIHFARSRGIPVGPGRGSAAGSIVAYCLKITDLDPLKYGLIFERFLNPGRISMPDIDIDFCYERRGEIIDYVTEKYGKDQVSQIITFGTMAARNAIRDVGRAMKIPLPEVDKIAKLVPFGVDMTLEKALEQNKELRQQTERHEKMQTMVNVAKSVEGFPRHASTHAAGVVISPTPLTDYVPLYRNSGTGDITTQYDMNIVSEIGLLKIDFLGLRTLTVIDNTLKLIEKRHGIKIDLSQIPLDDSKVYEMLSRADTDGLFQLESSGMRDLLRRLAPTNFEDISSVIALYRPGPLGSGMIEDFISRRHGKTQTEYLHPDLESILKNTYGVMVYQEQVMQISSKLAGFSMESADYLRKAMGKKDRGVMEKQKEAFINGCLKNKIDKKVAQTIFDLMDEFAGYGFNKSHTAAYAMVAYQTAYLKAYYAVEYMASLLTSEMGNHDKMVTYIKACRNMGIDVQPPDINESYANFTVTDDQAIRFGLAAVKNVGKAAIDSILTIREIEKFKSLFDFCSRVDTGKVNSKVIESLIKCGAFDSLGAKRSQMLNILPQALSHGSLTQRDKEQGQISFFDTLDVGNGNGTHEPEFPKIPELHEAQLLQFEKDLLGFYVTGHPLEQFESVIERYTDCSAAAVQEKPAGQTVNLGGVIVDLKLKRTKKGDNMADVFLEDFSGIVSLRAFPEAFEKNREMLQKDRLVFVTGRVDTYNENTTITLQSVMPLEQVESKLTNSFHVALTTVGLNDQILLELQSVLTQHKGSCRTYLHFITPSETEDKETEIRTDSHNSVVYSPELVTTMETLVGKDSVWYSNKG